MAAHQRSGSRSQTSPGICVAHACGSDLQDSKSRGWNIAPVGLWTGHTRIACCSRCFWPCGGPRIWQQRVFIMGNANADRVDRRDKSIFRLGRLWLLDILRRVCNRASLKRCFRSRNAYGVALCLALLTQQAFWHRQSSFTPACNKCLGGSLGPCRVRGPIWRRCRALSGHQVPPWNDP